MKIVEKKHGQTEKRRQTERDLIGGDPRNRLSGPGRADGNDRE